MVALLEGRRERILVLALACEHVLFVGGVHRPPPVGHPHVAADRKLVVGAREVSHDRVTRAVGEQPALEPRPPAATGALGDDGRDPARIRLHGIHAMLEKERDGGLRAHHPQLQVVGEILGRLARHHAGAFEVGEDLLDDVAHVGEGRDAGCALGPDPHLRRAVAAEHGPVLHEGDREPLPCRRDCGARARKAAAHHDEIERAAVVGPVRQAEQSATEGVDRRDVVHGLESKIPAEEQRFAPALEAGEVVERNGRLRPDLDRASVVPVPVGVLRAEGLADGPAIEQHLKLPRRTGRTPRGHPVARPHPEPVAARRRERHARDGVGHGPAKTVGEQVGRSHLVHRLLIDHPAAEIVEALGLQKHELVRSRGGRAAPAGEEGERGAGGGTEEHATAHGDDPGFLWESRGMGAEAP